MFQGGASNSGITIEHLGIVMPNVGANQNGLQFGELRNSTIQNNYIIGPSGPSPDHIGILLVSGTGSNVYSGGVLIDNNTIYNVYLGIALSGSNTTVTISRNVIDVGGTVTQGYASIGIDGAAECSGVIIEGNYIGSWDIGVYYQGTYLRQAFNFFERNASYNYDWVRGAGNARIWGTSIGDIEYGTTAHKFPKNNTDACIVIGQGDNYWDNFTVQMNSLNVGTPVAGFGTPSGNAVVANFPGASATLLQTSKTVAEILAVLKTAGLISA